MESESIRKMKIPFFCFEYIVLLKRRLDRIAIDKWTVVKLLVSLLPNLWQLALLRTVNRKLQRYKINVTECRTHHQRSYLESKWWRKIKSVVSKFWLCWEFIVIKCFLTSKCCLHLDLNMVYIVSSHLLCSFQCKILSSDRIKFVKPRRVEFQCDLLD